MRHDALRERLLDLAYGELSGREARKVEAHAAACEQCRAELARIHETRRLMAGLSDEPAPPEGERVLLAAAREAAGRHVPRRRLPPWLWGSAVVAASLVAVAAVSYRIVAMRPGPLSRPAAEQLLGDSPRAWPAPPEPAEAKRAAAPPEVPRERSAPARAAVPSPAPAPARPPPAGAARPAVRAPSAARVPTPEEASEPSATAPSPARAEDEAGTAGGFLGATRPPAVPAEGEERAPAPSAAAPQASAAAPEASVRMLGAPRPSAPARRAVAGSEKAALDARAALARYEALRADGRLETRSRTFPGCEGESRRTVETDPEGRVVRYVREGRLGGRRLRIEHVYGPDGALAGAIVHDLDGGGTPDADALGIVLPGRAAQARLDAPPRCGR